MFLTCYFVGLLFANLWILLVFCGEFDLTCDLLIWTLECCRFFELLLHSFAFPWSMDCYLIHVPVLCGPSVCGFLLHLRLSPICGLLVHLEDLITRAVALYEGLCAVLYETFCHKFLNLLVLTTCQSLIGGFCVSSVGSGCWRFYHSLDIAGICILSWGFMYLLGLAFQAPFGHFRRAPQWFLVMWLSIFLRVMDV